MKNKILKLGVLGIAIGAMAFANSANALSIKDNNITLRMGSGHPPFINYVKSMSKFFAPKIVKRVAKETKYTIKFKEHYAGTVVKVFDTLEGVQDGRLDIGGWCVCFDDDKAMAMNLVYYVPFSDPDGNKAVKQLARLVEMFPDINKDYEERYNQKLIGISGFSNYGLLTSFNWDKFEDLKGRKILAAGPNLPWVKGGIPVRTTIPTAAQQLQTGVGDGIILFPDVDYKLKLHEATKGGYYTVTDFGSVAQISLTMNLKTRKKLPPEVLKIIDEVGKEYTTVSMAQSMKDHDWGLKMLKEAGVTIKKIDPAAKKAWAEALKDWPNERAQAVKKKKGIDMPTIMKAFIQMQKDDGHTFPIDYVIK